MVFEALYVSAKYCAMQVRGAYDKFPDFFRMGM